MPRITDPRPINQRISKPKGLGFHEGKLKRAETTMEKTKNQLTYMGAQDLAKYHYRESGKILARIEQLKKARDTHAIAVKAAQTRKERYGSSMAHAVGHLKKEHSR